MYVIRSAINKVAVEQFNLITPLGTLQSFTAYEQLYDAGSVYSSSKSISF